MLTISKLLEKIVYSCTYDFLNSTHQIFDSQYGSCEHAIQELLGNILKGYEHDKSTIAVLLDLSKAFDTISHRVLFEKLALYGIQGSCLDCFKSYLTGCRMRGKCLGEAGEPVHSDLCTIEYGTPQGSVLGPLIFLIFNNDLHLHLLYCNCILFADDTTLYATYKDLHHLVWCIREDLEVLSDWFMANKLTLNLNKSVCMLFSKKYCSSMSPCLPEIGLPIVPHTKFLGVYIDEKLSWNIHFNNVVLKIKRNMNLLKRSQNLLNTHAK